MIRPGRGRRPLMRGCARRQGSGKVRGQATHILGTRARFGELRPGSANLKLGSTLTPARLDEHRAHILQSSAEATSSSSFSRSARGAPPTFSARYISPSLAASTKLFGPPSGRVRPTLARIGPTLGATGGPTQRCGWGLETKSVGSGDVWSEFGRADRTDRRMDQQHWARLGQTWPLNSTNIYSGGNFDRPRGGVSTGVSCFDQAALCTHGRRRRRTPVLVQGGADAASL